MGSKLQDKVAIVTGATGGIGREIVKALASEGAKVLMADINEKALKSLKKEIGENIEYYSGDLCDLDMCRKIAAHCKDTFGKLDILVNSVGVALRKPLLDVTKEEFMKLYEVNVYTTLSMTQACYELLKDSDSSDIISIVSSSGMYPHIHQGAYCSTKYAQRALNEVLNIELFDDDIRVHNLYPSAVETPMAKIARGDLAENMSCKPEEIAEIIVFILSNRNNSVIDNLIIRRYTKRPDEM